MKDLQEALSLKIDTISKLQAGRSAQDVEIQQLRNLVSVVAAGTLECNI